VFIKLKQVNVTFFHRLVFVKHTYTHNASIADSASIMR